MKKMILLCIFFCSSILFTGSVFGGNSDNDDATFELLPKATNPQGAAKSVDDLGSLRDTPGNKADFSTLYNSQAEDLAEKDENGFGCTGLGNQFASGIMNRDTILCLVSQVVRFIANMALVVGSGMIIYAGYMYGSSVFFSENVGKGSEAIKRAIIGIVLVIFAYAILNMALNAFL